MEGGREYANHLKSQELTEGHSLSGAKGFGFLRYRPVPLKGQRMQFITLLYLIIRVQRIIGVYRQKGHTAG